MLAHTLKKVVGWFRTKGWPSDDLDINRALEFQRRRDFGEALRRGELILAAAPHVALSWRFKGECLFFLERYTEALESFDKAATIGGPGTDTMFLWKARCLYFGGRPEQARELLQHFLASDPGIPELMQRARADLAKFEKAV